MSITIGVLAIQGDVQENIFATQKALDELGISGHVIPVKTPDEIYKLNGLIIPGGESTTIGQLSLVNRSRTAIKEKIEQGMPVFGICAGMIVLSTTADDRVVGKTNQPLLEFLDIQLERNSFGSQRNSFEANVSLNSINIPKFNGVFIRAPSVSSMGPGVEVLSKYEEKIVAVRKGNIIGTSFHPELTQDTALHKYFVNLVNQARTAS